MTKVSRQRILNKLRNYSTENLVLAKEVGNNAVVILNRPKSLNSITLPLQFELLKMLKKFEKTKSLVIIKGAGDRDLSSGGDLITFKKEILKNAKYMEDMLLYTNTNIYLIYRYKKPILALMNGYTVGGGVGYSIFARYRIVTEKTKFMMPEIKIGFNPNATASYFLNRAPGKLGYYLGLTGNILNGADVLRVGYATHLCKSNNLSKLEEKILECSNEADVDEVLENICEKCIPEFSLSPLTDKINKCFSEPTVEGIIQRLKEDGSAWATETLKKLNSFSPTGLKVALRQLQRGKDMNLVDILLMEGSISINLYNLPDVYEGTRVLLQDKGDTPKWTPSKLSDVTEEIINGCFKLVSKERQKQLFKEIDDRHKLDS